MEIYDALKVAVELLRARQEISANNYRLTASRVEDQWVFWFVFLPATPGLDITVFVSDNGQARTMAGM